jgi:hypothetical protein
MKTKIFTLLLALYAPVLFAQDYMLLHPDYEITYADLGYYDHRFFKVLGYSLADGDTVFET